MGRPASRLSTFLSPIGSGRRRWLLLGAGVLALLALAILWAGGSLTTRDRTWERIQEEGVLRIGMDASFPPFEMIHPETGEPIGLDVELAYALGERMGGIEPAFSNVGFDGLYDSLLAGRFDAIISALPVDYTWTRDVRYSRPYFEAGLVLATSTALAGEISQPEDLAGRRVAIEWGSEGDAYGRQLARRIGEIDLEPMQTPADALRAVQVGDAEAALVDAVSAHLFIAGAGGADAGLVIHSPPLTEVSYAVAVRYTSPLLAGAIDAALAELREEGVLDELIARWLQ